MDEPRTRLKDAFKYPVILTFFAFLAVLMLADLLEPDREDSQLERRELAQSPAFTLSSLVSNEWTYNYGEYIRDQFVARDEWVSAYSLLEAAQGKLESGGVFYARDAYQIAKPNPRPPGLELEINVQSVCEFSTRWPEKVRVMLAPSPASILRDKLRYNPPLPDEAALCGEMYAAFEAAGASTIDLRPAFTESAGAGQQLYYRTDHHWTTDGGALLAYQAYCESVGRAPVLPDDSLKVEVPGFLGTNFAKTKRPGTAAESILYYDLPNAMDISRIGGDGGITTTSTGLMDKEQFDGHDKYAAFLHGNNGFSVIQGNGAGSLLVIKDSYGNSFVPYLLENYASVAVMDLRAWNDVDATVRAGAYDEILVLYSVGSFVEDPYVRGLSNDYQQP